jgi:predicted metal-dependent hydrolase
MPEVKVRVQLRDGRWATIIFEKQPTPEEIDREAAALEALLGISPPTPAAQPTQAQQLAGALRSTLQRGWNWLRSKLGWKSPEERAAEIAGPAMTKHPEAMAEMARIESARRQATALPAMIRDAVIAPGNLAAEKRYGSALQQNKAQASTGSRMEQVGTVTQLGNLLGLPQRGAVAWAKQIATRHGVPGSKYADAGEAFMDAAEWGALLEDLAPQLPKPVRQALSVPADILLDPLILVPPAKVANVLGPIASKLPGAAKVGRTVEALQGKALSFLHPTVARALEQAGLEASARNIRRTLAAADELAGASVEGLISNFPNMPLEAFGPAAKAAGDLASRRFLIEYFSEPFERAFRRIETPWRPLEAYDVSNAARLFVDEHADILMKLSKTSDEQARSELLRQLAERLLDEGYSDEIVGDLLERAGRIEPPMPSVGIGEAAATEALRRRLVDQSDPEVWQRAMGWWKRAVTSLNLPAGAVRNFLGNFLAQYLAGETLKWSSRPFGELLKEAFSGTTYTRAGDIGADVLRRGEPPKQALARAAQSIAEKAGEIYSGADKLAAAVLAKISDKPPTHFMISDSFRLPERIEWLSRVGLVPFATWPTWIAPRLLRGAWENPARWHRLAMALQAGGVQEKDNNLFKPLPGNRALNLEPFLPISPYMLSASEGDLPDLLQRWPPLAIARDITDALAGAPAKPAALSTTSPVANALITAGNYALPPSFWNALRLVKPEWFADIPRSPLTPQDYLLRLMGLGIIRDPSLYAVIRRRRELERLRRLMRRTGIRANQMNPDDEE